jgi:O-antigen/teichoic acid export membrane protein
MSKIKRLAGDTVLYGVGSMLPRILNFLLVPLHTINTFSRGEYGVITSLFAIVAFVNVVYLFGMETTFFRFASKEGADKKRIFNLAQTVVLVISVSLSVVFIGFASPIASSMGVGVKPEYIIWLSIILFIDASTAIPFAQLRLERKAFLFASAKVANVVLLFGLNYYFLKINFDPTIGVGYVFFSNLIANSFFVLFFLKTLLGWRPDFDKEISGQMFRYAYPVMLTGLAGMTNEMFSRLTLEWWLPAHFYRGQTTQEALGVFGACYKFAVLMNLAVQAFRYAAEPFFFSHAVHKDSPQLFAKINHYFVITCCLFLLGVGINLDLLKYFIGPEFWDGLYIVPVLLLAYLFLGVYYNVSVWFKVTDRTYYGTLISVGGAVLTIALNYLLIPSLGYYGSSIAAALVYGTMLVTCYVFGQKYYPIPYRLVGGVVYVVSTLVLVLAVNAIAFPNQIIATGCHLAIVVCYIGIVYTIERKELLLEVFVSRGK